MLKRCHTSTTKTWFAYILWWSLCTYIFQVLINSLVCWFCLSALGLDLLLISTLFHSLTAFSYIFVSFWGESCWTWAINHCHRNSHLRCCSSATIIWLPYMKTRGSGVQSTTSENQHFKWKWGQQPLTTRSEHHPATSPPKQQRYTEDSKGDGNTHI